MMSDHLDSSYTKTSEHNHEYSCNFLRTIAELIYTGVIRNRFSQGVLIFIF